MPWLSQIMLHYLRYYYLKLHEPLLAFRISIFRFFFFFNIFPWMELLNHVVVLVFIFLEKCPYCFLYWLHQFTLLLTVHKDSLSSTFSTTFVTCSFRWAPYWYSSWFYFAFLWWLKMLSIFVCAFGYLYGIFGKLSIRSSAI